MMSKISNLKEDIREVDVSRVNNLLNDVKLTAR